MENRSCSFVELLNAFLVRTTPWNKLSPLHCFISKSQLDVSLNNHSFQNNTHFFVNYAMMKTYWQFMLNVGAFVMWRLFRHTGALLGSITGLPDNLSPSTVPTHCTARTCSPGGETSRTSLPLCSPCCTGSCRCSRKQTMNGGKSWWRF